MLGSGDAAATAFAGALCAGVVGCGCCNPPRGRRTRPLPGTKVFSFGSPWWPANPASWTCCSMRTRRQPGWEPDPEPGRHLGAVPIRWCFGVGSPSFRPRIGGDLVPKRYRFVTLLVPKWDRLNTKLVPIWYQNHPKSTPIHDGNDTENGRRSQRMTEESRQLFGTPLATNAVKRWQCSARSNGLLSADGRIRNRRDRQFGKPGRLAPAAGYASRSLARRFWGSNRLALVFCMPPAAIFASRSRSA